METINEKAKVDLTKIHNTIIPNIPPWTIRNPKVILTLCKLQIKISPLIFQEELGKVKHRYSKHSHIFSNRSKQENTTGCTAIYNEKIIQKRLPNNISIFNTEADMVLDLISKLKTKKFIIFFDSLLMLTSLQSKKFDSSLII